MQRLGHGGGGPPTGVIPSVGVVPSGARHPGTGVILSIGVIPSGARDLKDRIWVGIQIQWLTRSIPALADAAELSGPAAQKWEGVTIPSRVARSNPFHRHKRLLTRLAS